MIDKNAKMFDVVIGGVTRIYADRHCYELRHAPRGRICRVAQCDPLTALQRAMVTAKQLQWIPEDTTLESCAVPCSPSI